MSCDALHDIQLEIERVQNSNSDIFARRINEENYIQKAPKYLFTRDQRANSFEHVTREKKHSATDIWRAVP
jgi:hypothetical protein